MPAFEFAVRRWGCWPPLAITDSGSCVTAPDLGFVPAMMRRRLSPLAKAVFHAASHCLEPQEQIPLILSSVNGEIQRTVDVLGDICSGDGVSPTAFSLSVHNAIAGQLSIVFENRAPMLALAPTQQGALPALLEAIGLLAENADRDVVVALFDEPLPELFDKFAPSPTAATCIALRLSRPTSGREHRLQLTSDLNSANPATLADIAQFLDNPAAVELPLCTSAGTWIWSRQRD